MIRSFEFSRSLGDEELRQAVSMGLPQIVGGNELTIARRTVIEGRQAFVRGRYDERDVMVSLEPTDQAVDAFVTPALHFISGAVSGGNKLDDFIGIMQAGFVNTTMRPYNAYLLTSRYMEQLRATVQGGYMGLISELSQPDLAGDSLRILLWSGFSASYIDPLYHGDLRLGCVVRTAVDDLQGIALVAEGEDFDERVERYRGIYSQNKLIAPLYVVDAGGKTEMIS